MSSLSPPINLEASLFRIVLFGSLVSSFTKGKVLSQAELRASN